MSLKEHEVRQSKPRSLVRRVEQHKQEYAGLPSGEFTTQHPDVNLSKKALHRGINANILLKQGREYIGNGDVRNIYRLNPDAKELLESYQENPDTICPCDCIQDGVNNPKDEPGYRCPHCGEQFTREELNG